MSDSYEFATHRASARAISAQQLRRVARTDLTHFDAAVELRRELSHELQKIDAGLGGEMKHEPLAVKLLLDLDLWVANYYSARNPLRLSSLVILGVVARMFRCATRSSCWCT